MIKLATFIGVLLIPIILYNYIWFVAWASEKLAWSPMSVFFWLFFFLFLPIAVTSIFVKPPL